MGRMKSDSLKSVAAELTVTDLVYYVARNSTTMLTERVLGKLLFDNESAIQSAMKKAAMEAIKSTLDALAGIQPDESIEILTAEVQDVVEAGEISASLPAKRGKSQTA